MPQVLPVMTKVRERRTTSCIAIRVHMRVVFGSEIETIRGDDLCVCSVRACKGLRPPSALPSPSDAQRIRSLLLGVQRRGGAEQGVCVSFLCSRAYPSCMNDTGHDDVRSSVVATCVRSQSGHSCVRLVPSLPRMPSPRGWRATCLEGAFMCRFTAAGPRACVNHPDSCDTDREACIA
jgi:hypothetical protein